MMDWETPWGGVDARPYLWPWVGCGGLLGAVGTRGGAGAPPTAYQPLVARGK